MSTLGNAKYKDSDSTNFQGSSTVSLADEDMVFTSMEMFCTRIRNMLDIINTLAQFGKLCEAVKDLPRLPMEVLSPEEETPREGEGGDQEPEGDMSRTISDISFEEDEEVISDDNPSISSELEEKLQDMKDSLFRSISATNFPDILGKDREKFELGYSEYVNNVRKIEACIGHYVEGIFTLKLSVERSLQILSRFECVVNRPGLKSSFSEKYVAVFSQFEEVLEEVQNLYETQKESPPLSRNAPIVSGAISWSRGLLRKIEEPMKIFKENKFVTALRDFSRIVKFYNRIATALVKFESLWLTMWKSRIESAKVALKLPLLAHHFETKELVVNADERVVELIQECKGLLRFGISLPENALEVFRQESRFKNYKQHLEFVLKDYSNICSLVPEPLKKLLLPHMESVIQYLQPGMSTLAWNSMNIDAYLHQVHLANSRLRVVVESVNKVVVDGIHRNINALEKSVLFDLDLAYEKRWEADRFKVELKKSIKKKQTDLSSMLKNVENSIQEVITLAAHHRSITPISPGHTPRLNISPNTGRAGVTSTSMSGMTEESIIGEIYTHYCGMAHKALLQCIHKSLMVFYHSVCPAEMIKDITNCSENSSSRPSSAASTLSSSSEWAVPNPSSDLLQFEVEIKFNIPDIVITPTLSLVQSQINDVTTSLVDVCKDIQWWAVDTRETLYQSISQNSGVSSLVRYISDVVTCLQNAVDRQLFRFHRYDFLWKEDLHALYQAFVDTEPSTAEFHREVERLQSIEQDIFAIPDLLIIGSVCLNTTPVKDSLHGLAVAWKMKYSTELHEIAKADLQQLVDYREEMQERLSCKVVTLESLNEILNLLQELNDRDNTIDEVYLPVENSYMMLRKYELSLPRKEVEEVNNLRDCWRSLMDLADQVHSELMVDKRNIFEQELDREVKRFVVEVIQFRNSFDSQGPGVPGVLPADAVERLHNFQKAYSEHEVKRKILDAVQLLFGFSPTHYPELDRTGEELVLLGLLYGLFQQYISFDESFREKLWADVDLIKANFEVESYWQQCLKLPDRIQEWQAYKDMKSYIKQYLDVFPILHKLASKEIRNRHWLQVMSVTGSSFQLEANVFRLKYLLDNELISHQDEIKNICSSASRELELEVKMRNTEEEWTEQVLQFEKFKDGAMYCLSNQHTEGLLELLEDAQSSLAMMLTSKYIGPLQQEAAAWAMKLKEVSEVLEQWLAVQDFWRYLEAVFSNSVTAKDLPQEFARFARVDKSYMKMTKRARDTKNVLQCCVGGDIPKIQVLKHLYEELDVCFKSLQVYLNARRKVFPRFYFVSDLVLLAILSQPYTLDSVKPHFKSLFVDLADIALKPRSEYQPKCTWNMAVNNVKKTMKEEEDQGANLFLPPHRKPSQNMQSEHELGRTISRNLSTSVSTSSYSEWRIVYSDAVSVTSEKGETLQLKKEVFLNGGVELWLSELSRVLQATVHETIVKCIGDANTLNYIDEIAQKYPPQVACLGLLYMWTRECETAIADIRMDRKALPNAVRRFWSILSRLPNILIKGSWRNVDQNLTVAAHDKLEALLSYGMYLRDIVDDLGKRKLRDVTDFEWKRNTRFYGDIREKGKDGKPHSLLHLLENDLEYGNEFYGSRMPIVLTPITERCFLTLTKAVTEYQCGAIIGASGTGKTETAKGLAHMLGQYFVSLSCTPKMDFGQVAKIFTGLAQEGCWGILDEFHRVPPAVVSVIFHYVQTVIDAIKVGSSSCFVDEGKEIVIKPTFNVLVTVTSDDHSFTMTTELKAYFRTIAMVMPDMSLILRAHCAGQGLKSPKVLADRYTMVAKICQGQLSNTAAETFGLSSFISVVKTLGEMRRSQNTSNQTKISTMTSDFQMRPTSNTSMLRSSKYTASVDKDKKAGSPSSGLTTAAKLDHSCAMQVLQQCIGPRLSQEDLGIFNGVVRDVFSGSLRVPFSTDQHIMNERSFESLLVKHASENGLIARPQWTEKVVQMYHLSKKNHGIIVAGGPGSGKTSCITSLVETLARWSLVIHGNTGAQVHAHKLQRINPLAVSDISLMFGQLGPNGDWIDGIFTSYWRKANKEHNVHRTTTWLCLDAPLHQGWAENLSSVLDNGKYLTLENCERLHLTDDVRIVFETDDLTNASPAILSRTAMVYMDDDVLGWQPLAEAYVNERTSSMERKCLMKVFNNTLDPISHFVLHDAKPLMKICEVGLFRTCLSLLESLMHNNSDLSGELHIERLFLFSLIWSFGILLDDQDRKKFGDLLLTLTTGLPDYDQDISVFDYYLDESGEWELWRSRVPDESYFDAADLLGEVFVETDQTIRIRLLMDLVRMSGRNILLVGPEGAGKSCLVNDFLDKQVTENKRLMVRRFVYSSNSTASSLQRFIESNIHHRQGYDYGARGGKILSVFIEDLNLPEADVFGIQEVNELLRQLLDDRALYKLQKPFEWRKLEDLVVIATMNTSFKAPATGSHTPISNRLKRHFAVFCLPKPAAKTLFSIVTCVLEGNMSHNQGMGLQQELHEQITEATCAMIESVQQALRASPTPGRLHYHFNLRDVARVFQGLKNCPEEMRADEDYVVSLWQHEVHRVVGDRISRSDDSTWFERKVKDLTKTYFPEKPANSPSQFFVTFATDTKELYTGRAVASSKAVTKTTHQAVVSLDEVIPCLETYLTRYNDEFSTSPLNLMLSNHIISHVIRIHRILSIKNSGNLLLVGPIGSQLSDLAALALYMLEYPIHTIDCSYRGSFLDGLRSAVRRAGCDGKTTTIIIKDRELLEDSYLEAINSLLVSGEYPPLFSEDEINSLLQALMPSIKRKFSSFLTDPMKFFLTRVKRNLHIILCLQPTHKILSSTSSHYPGILSNCHINWVKHWGEEALVGKAKHFLRKHDLFQDETSSVLRPSVVSTLASIHEFVLQDCHHIPWAGGMAINPGGELETKDLKQAKNDSNNEYGRDLLMERIALANRQIDVALPNEVFVGPTTYDRLLHCFMSLLKKKEGETKNLLNDSRLCLDTLSEARQDADKLKDYITKTKSEFEEANQTTAKLLEDLTAKSTVLEKLKAKLGVGSDTLRSFIALIDSEIDDDDSYLFVDEEKDELDEEFERIQVAKMKSKKAKTVEEIAMAEREQERLRSELDEAKDQVLVWQERLDRTCCERLKAIQSPPTMIGLVMLMTMTLLGKHEFSPFISTPSTTGRHDRKSFDGAAVTDDTSSIGGKKRNRLEPSQLRAPPQSSYAGISSDGKMDRQTWKAIQTFMSDSQKFAEALHGVSWEEGLSDDIVRSVEPFFAKNELGELGKSLRSGTSKGNTSPGKHSPQTERRHSVGITVTAARYSSEDAVILVEYVLSLLEYTKKYKPYRKVLDYIAELSAEQEEHEKLTDDERYSEDDFHEEKPADGEPEPVLTEADLPRLEQELETLQEEFDKAVMVKYDLQDEVNASSERLRVAQELLQRLKDFEEDSRVFVTEYSSSEVLLSNCMSAAAFLTYCGPMGIDQRKKMVAYFTNASSKHGLPKESKQVFYDLPLCEYLNGKLALKMLQHSKALTDPLSLDNSCLVNQEETANTWPLICDPQRVAQSLVTALNQVTIVKFKELRGHLETCLMEGTQLFVTDVDLGALVEDDRFYYILRNVPTFLKATNPFKLLVGEHEIECQPSFRLFMSTTCLAYRVPAKLSAVINVIEMYLSRDGLEEMFLDRFMGLEKPRIQDSRQQSVSELVRLLKMKDESERKFLEVLLKNRQFLHDLATMKKISSIRRNFEETVESITRVEQSEASLLHSREAFRPIARRAAVLFDVTRHMGEVNEKYTISLAQFLKIFDTAIQHSERTAVKAVAERVGQSAFFFAAQGFMEKDRTLFALLSAIEVEDSFGRVSPGDREFLIYPAYGSAVKTALSHGTVTTSQTKIINAKKPFDWMTDEQYNGLQLLAQSFDWFQEPFEKMTKDGRETQWRQLVEHEIPELVALPDNLDEKFTPMQRFMIIRAIRPDRLVQTSRSFIIQGLGRRYTSDLPLDLAFVHRQSDSRTPVLLLYDEESSILQTLVRDLAGKKQVDLSVVHLATGCSNEERYARRSLHKAMTEGTWLLLLDGHNSPRLLDMLDSLISDKQIEGNFRLWISAKITSPLPCSLLQLTVKVVADSPKNIRDNLVRSMSLVDSDILASSTRSEWPAILHNVCVLHNVVRLRSQYQLVGWNEPEVIKPGALELYDAIRVAAREFGEHTSHERSKSPVTATGKAIQWNALRYMLAEVVYGKIIRDEFDQQSLNAIVDYWISPAAVKKEFEASRVKYRLPSVFFSGNVRLPTLVQSLESLPANVLDVPEACGLHSSPETVVAHDQYIFTRLNWIYDRMPVSSTLTHACVESDFYTPTKGVVVVSGQTQLPGASFLAVDKSGVFASASLWALRNRRDVDLLEICTSALNKVPRPWSKEAINEKLKKGGVTSFSLFVLSEVEQMQKLILTIREDLQIIKTSVSDGVHGDLVPPDVLEAANALYHLRIPSRWLRLAGDSSPPGTWSLSAWLADLQSRHSHIERVVTQGRDRVPAYWLGAFFNPKRLLAIVKQEAIRNFESSGRSSVMELFVLQSDITGRDKDHLREPPLEGIFVYGLYMWGCAWEKTTGDLMDAAPRHGPTPLPVIHLTVVPQSEKHTLHDPQKAAVSYSCPCYPSRICSREPVLQLDIDNKDVSASRWALRGLCATLRPF
ncbi:dynein heavy chain 8, axonemal-like isoform X2 [Dendronephthya gigantea]|uniref:dynein heavy chain 8, axonemal-like isoform X2 n=1 Tax=Dendronephthya gigantea TaxID=151771 RepID=UPI00106B2AA1|nr:dynein heavy chain 8, axonemal-like isoform X2 [Dendronephthya gigantea]